jgi:hypothetical protein
MRGAFRARHRGCLQGLAIAVQDVGDGARRDLREYGSPIWLLRGIRAAERWRSVHRVRTPKVGYYQKRTRLAPLLRAAISAGSRISYKTPMSRPFDRPKTGAMKKYT